MHIEEVSGLQSSLEIDMFSGIMLFTTCNMSRHGPWSRWDGFSIFTFFSGQFCNTSQYSIYPLRNLAVELHNRPKQNWKWECRSGINRCTFIILNWKCHHWSNAYSLIYWTFKAQAAGASLLMVKKDIENWFLFVSMRKTRDLKRTRWFSWTKKRVFSLRNVAWTLFWNNMPHFFISDVNNRPPNK